MSTFSERLKSLRLKNRITATQLGEIVGVSRSIISKYENNHRMPGRGVIQLFAEYFNVSIDYLLGYVDNPENAFSKLSEGVQIMMREGNKLTLEQQKAVISVIKQFVKENENNNKF